MDTSPTTTVTLPPTTTTSTTTVAQTPAPIGSVARLPDETTLQDGTWAAIVFHQPLDCVSDDADLAAAEPVDCDEAVLFEGEGQEEVVGAEVPVWLLRWPVLAYALGNGMTTLADIRGLPTLIEGTAAYAETAEAISLSGSIPDVGPYRLEVDAGVTRFEVPFEAGSEVSLSELTGAWDMDGHVLRVDEGGSYELFATSDGDAEEETGVFGFIALQDGLLIFATSANPGPCAGETGVYFAHMVGPGLRIGAVDEPCEFRSEAFGSKWSLSSDE